MAFLASLFGYLLNFIYDLVNNYGLAIIIFTIIIKLLMLPISIKQQKTMKKSVKIQEKVRQLQFKYKNNPEQLNKATIELYKSEKMSPFSGCLSSILQLIIIISVFFLVSRPLTYMKKVDSAVIDGYIEEIKQEDGSVEGYPEIQVINRRASVDDRVNINMDFFGLDLSMVPQQNLTDYRVYIIPLLYVITSFVSIKITNASQNKTKKNKTKLLEEKNETKELSKEEKEKDSQEEAMESMQSMNNAMTYMVPIMSISIAFIAPLGLALYWLVSNILLIIERLIINKIFKEKDDKEEKINA